MPLSRKRSDQSVPEERRECIRRSSGAGPGTSGYPNIQYSSGSGRASVRRRSLYARFRLVPGVLGVGHPDDAEQDDEQRDGAEDQAAEAGRLVARVRSAAHATRTFVMTSFFLICFMTSRPSVIFPNTV